MTSESTKCCVSGRPSTAFNSLLAGAPMLQLQDLTKDDISTYVFDSLKSRTSPHIQPMADKIIRDAEGVFIWAKLVVKDINKGLENGDDSQLLQDRLRSLPKELGELYARMLKDLDELYKAQAAMSFQLILNRTENDLTYFGVGISKQQEEDSDPTSFTKLSVKDALRLCTAITARLPTICAGMIETAQTKDRRNDSEPTDVDDTSLYAMSWPFPDQSSVNDPVARTELLVKLSRISINMIHRTAVDFLRESRAGMNFLADHTPPKFYASTLMLKASLAACRLCGIATQTEYRPRSGSISCGHRHRFSYWARFGTPPFSCISITDRNRARSTSNRIL